MATIPLVPTLQRRVHPLASSDHQKAMLEALPLAKTFDQAASEAGHRPLERRRIDVLQLNLGKRCNQTCLHCHVDAGPDRRETMSQEVLEACLSLLERSDIPTVDITGGAPELHPRFRELVRRARALGRHVMDRCNLTITGVPNHTDLPEFLASHQVEVVASLPAFAARGTDAQRGAGVFAESIEALRRFNALGYGQEGSSLVLNLVTNPVGAFLPPNQGPLEREWKRELKRRYDISFNHLYTITNMPISRFLEFLMASGNLEAYMERLVNAFNPVALDGVMCRSMLSVGWDGQLYDCDFNQMLDLPLAPNVRDVDLQALQSQPIRTGQHCFGCTAGAGSSCGGATAS